MSNLDKIKNKVIAEAEAQAKAILEDAQNESKAYLEQLRLSTESELAKQKQYAEEHATGIKQRVEASSQLKARDCQLAARQALLDEVFAKAKEKLLKMSDDKLAGLISEKLEQRKFKEGEVLVLPEGKELKLDTQIPVEHDPALKVGFAFRDGGVSEKYDFLEILDLQREDLEQEILKIMQIV